MSQNSLTIHPAKREILIISIKKFTGPLPKVELEDKVIEIVPTSKCLGINIDQDLSWSSHTQNLCKACSSKVKKLFKMRAMSKSTLSTIYLFSRYSTMFHMVP